MKDVRDDVFDTSTGSSSSNKSFSSVQSSSTCEINGDEYVPVDADASPLGVVAYVDSGWPRTAVVADGGWLGPAVVTDGGWLGPAVVTDDGWL